MNEEIEQFDKQIRREWKVAGGNKEHCPSYWQKLLYIETMKLNHSDWQEIRDEDYFVKRDKLSGIRQAKFILARIAEYHD